MIESTISDFVAGDDLEIERTVRTIPSGSYITQAWFTVKRRYSDLDADAIVSKLITTSNTIGIGWIEDTGVGDTEGIIHFYLTPADTAILTPLSEYPYSIKLKFANGKLNTPESGKIIALPAVKQGST